jgi:transcriptional regulator with XRE-family HTH domain
MHGAIASSILKVSIKIMTKSIRKVSIRQLKAARALLDWSQDQLAVAAKVSAPTIKRLEAQEGPLGGRNETGSKIREALEIAGIEFIEENGGGPGVRLQKRRSKKG